MLDTVVMSGDDVCCSVVFGTLVGVFGVMWSELLMTSAISCPCGHQCTSAREWSVRSHLRCSCLPFSPCSFQYGSLASR